MEANKEQVPYGTQVRNAAAELSYVMHMNKIPLNVGMASLAMLLAQSGKSCGMTRHEVIDRFVSSVNIVYSESSYGKYAGSEGKEEGS